MIVDNPRKRRWTDRAPLTSRMGWSFWKAVHQVERNIGGVAGTLFLLFFWTLLAFCLLSPQP